MLRTVSLEWAQDSHAARMEDSRPDQHVFLTPVSLTPRGEDEKCMYVCERVQESVIRRSAVLTALHETTGVVSLPNGISVRAFSVWKRAADGGAEPSVAELATVVKVSLPSPCCAMSET